MTFISKHNLLLKVKSPICFLDHISQCLYKSYLIDPWLPFLPLRPQQHGETWHRHLLSQCSWCPTKGSSKDESHPWSPNVNNPWYQARISKSYFWMWQSSSIVTICQNLTHARITILQNNICNWPIKNIWPVIALWFSKTILLRLLQTISSKVGNVLDNNWWQIFVIHSLSPDIGLFDQSEFHHLHHQHHQGVGDNNNMEPRQTTAGYQAMASLTSSWVTQYTSDPDIVDTRGKQKSSSCEDLQGNPDRQSSLCNFVKLKVCNSNKSKSI